MRANPHCADTGFVLPSLPSRKVGKIAFVKDTSGSIGAELRNQFHGEEQGALEELNPEALVDRCCDAEVTHQRVLPIVAPVRLKREVNAEGAGEKQDG